MIVKDTTSTFDYLKQKKIVKLKTIMFASLAHDLRTPVNSIAAINNIMLSELPPKYSKMLNVSKASCFFLISLINDIMDMASVEQDRLRLEYTWFSLNEVVTQVVETNTCLAALKNIGVTLKVDQNLPKEIFSDSRRIFHSS